MSESLATRGVISDISISGISAPSATMTVNSNVIDLTWSTTVTLTTLGSDVLSWSIVATVGSPVSVLSIITLNPNITRIFTSDQTIGGTYALFIPAGAVQDGGGSPNTYGGLGFTGSGHYPSFVSVVPQTTTTLLATFSEPVVLSEATTASNYLIDNGLTCMLVTPISAEQFMLTANEMAPGVIYTVTSQNVHDLAGNPVT